MEGAPRDLVYQGRSMAGGQGETSGVTGCEGAGKWDEGRECVDGGASQGEVGARCQHTDGTCAFGELAGDGGVGEEREGGSESAESSGSEGEENEAVIGAGRQALSILLVCTPARVAGQTTQPRNDRKLYACTCGSEQTRFIYYMLIHGCLHINLRKVSLIMEGIAMLNEGLLTIYGIANRATCQLCAS